MAGFTPGPQLPGDGRVAVIDLVIYRNVAFEQGFVFERDGVAYDLTGFAVEAQVRGDGRRGGLLLDFETAPATITVTPLAGRVVLKATAALVAALPIVPAQWDLLITPAGGTPYPFIRGRVHIKRGSTVHD